jgi:hypothetical protein
VAQSRAPGGLRNETNRYFPWPLPAAGSRPGPGTSASPFNPYRSAPPPAAATNGDQVIYAFTTSTAFGTVQFFDHGCALTYLGDNNIVLDPDLASSLAGNVPMDGTLGSGPLLANSQWTLDVANSSASLSGSTLTLNLALSFQASTSPMNHWRRICAIIDA